MAIRWRLILKPWQRLVLKGGLHVLCAGYLLLIFYLAVEDQLGADPVAGLLNATGIGAINLLLVTLTLSPLSRWLGGEFMRFRRLLGLYVFVYALGHLATFTVFILRFNLAQLGDEIIKRPYITVGFVAILLLFALTVTSLNRCRRRMGHHWQQLHNMVYVILILILTHYTWSKKTIAGDIIIYWGLAITLLLLRIPKLQRWINRLRRRQHSPL